MPTKRTLRYYTIVLNKPLCKAHKRCYYRKTGKTFPRLYHPRKVHMSREDALRYSREANAYRRTRLKYEHEHRMGAHTGTHWSTCPLCEEAAAEEEKLREKANQDAYQIWDDVLNSNGMRDGI